MTPTLNMEMRTPVHFILHPACTKPGAGEPRLSCNMIDLTLEMYDWITTRNPEVSFSSRDASRVLSHRCQRTATEARERISVYGWRPPPLTNSAVLALHDGIPYYMLTSIRAPRDIDITSKKICEACSLQQTRICGCCCNPNRRNI